MVTQSWPDAVVAVGNHSCCHRGSGFRCVSPEEEGYANRSDTPSRRQLKEIFAVLEAEMEAGHRKLHPRAVWIFFYRSSLKGMCLAAFLGFFSGSFVGLNSAASFLLFVFLVGSGFAYLWATLSYRAYKYELTEYGFYKENGVIRKKHFAIPYGEIQKVDIHRGILERILDLSVLRIQIAGSYGPRKRHGLFGTTITMSFSSCERFGLLAEEELPGLSPEIAEQLNTGLLVRRAKGT